MGFRHTRKCKAMNRVVDVMIVTYVWIVARWNEKTGHTTVDLGGTSCLFSFSLCSFKSIPHHHDKFCYPPKSIYFICNHTETDCNVHLINMAPTECLVQTVIQGCW